MKRLVTLSIAVAAATLCGDISSAADISGTITYTGSRTGAVRIAAVQTIPGNKVLSLSGAGSVEIPTLTSLAGSEVTIQYWFRGSQIHSALRQQANGWVVAGWNGLHILHNDGEVNGISVGKGVMDGNWHHVMVTWKQNTADGFASYLDGKLVQKRNSSNTPIPNCGASVWLGSFGGNEQFTTGQMDAVAIWQRALTPGEIASSWNKALTGSEPGLLCYWTFDDTTYNDKTSNAHNGTPYGDAAIVDADIPGFNAGIAAVELAAPGPYTIPGLPVGPGYALTAYMDTNNSGFREAGEPFGTYAGNPLDLATSLSGVNVELREPPYVLTQPSSSRRSVGETADFSVGIAGSGPLSYQWYRDDVALVNDGRISGANTSQLHISALTTGDAGGYSCEITNSLGKVLSAAANLDVIVNGQTISGTFLHDGGVTGKVHTTVAQLRANKVLNLDGVNDTASTTLTDLSGDELSVEYWFKGTAITSAVRQQGSGWIVCGWGGDNLHILSFDGGTSGLKVSNWQTNAVDGNWHHVAMSWKRNTVDGWVTYFDGEVVEQRTTPDVAVPNIGALLYFGSYIGTGEFTAGQLDEIAVWGKALSRAEVRSHARNGLTGSEANLRGYWNFDDGFGGDLTPNSNHASLLNGAEIVDSVNPGLGASYSDVFSGVGPYQLTAIPAGNGYSLLAYMDVNGNGTRNPDEPQGSYAGNAFNLNGPLSGADIFLNDPPKVLTNPMTITVLEGGTILLNASATGTSNSLQWFHGFSPMVNGGRVTGAQSNILSITAAQLDDAGLYALRVTNVVGTATSSPASVVVQPSLITNQLIAYWNFDETTGWVADEFTGLALDGELANFPGDDSQWVAGLIGNAIRFTEPANAQYVIVRDYLKPTNTMSVSAWVWADSRPNWAGIAKNWGQNVVGQFHFGLRENMGLLDVQLTDGSGKTIQANETEMLPTGQWQHVAFVADGARVRLYRNGAQVAVSTNTYDGTLLTPPMSSIGIGLKTSDDGSVPSNTPGYWHGKMDDLAIWNRALSADELFGIYRTGLAGKNLAQAVAVRPISVSIQASGSQVTLHYSAGKLEWANQLTGPWTEVPAANPPSFTTTTGNNTFFRVR
jgi:hypothetical protein